VYINKLHLPNLIREPRLYSLGWLKFWVFCNVFTFIYYDKHDFIFIIGEMQWISNSKIDHKTFQCSTNLALKISTKGLIGAIETIKRIGPRRRPRVSCCFDFNETFAVFEMIIFWCFFWIPMSINAPRWTLPESGSSQCNTVNKKRYNIT
jgi:hypothetical protein